MRARNRTTVFAALAAGTLLVAACSADETDFRSAAEKTARETVEGLIEGDASADCADPGSTDVGTTFDCTGTASDGTVFTFSAEITKKTEVTVTLLDTGTPPGGATGDTTVGTLPAEDTLPAEETVPVTSGS